MNFAMIVSLLCVLVSHEQKEAVQRSPRAEPMSTPTGHKMKNRVQRSPQVVKQKADDNKKVSAVFKSVKSAMFKHDFVVVKEQNFKRCGKFWSEIKIKGFTESNIRMVQFHIICAVKMILHVVTILLYNVYCTYTC